MLDFGAFPVRCNTAEEKRLCIESWKLVRSISLKEFPSNLFSEKTTIRQDLHRVAMMIQARNAALDEDVRFVSTYLIENGFKIPCALGCSACCKQAIVSNPFEAALVGIYIARNRALYDYFNVRYAQWENETRDTRVGFMDWARRYYSEGVDDGRFKYTDFRVSCVFLENDICKIYPVRPYCCRSYMAMSELCRNATDHDVHPGFQGVDVGAYTNFAANNKQFVGSLWHSFGIDAKNARGELLPVLVNRFLSEPLNSYFEYCECF